MGGVRGELRGRLRARECVVWCGAGRGCVGFGAEGFTHNTPHSKEWCGLVRGVLGFGEVDWGRVEGW